MINVIKRRDTIGIRTKGGGRVNRAVRAAEQLSYRSRINGVGPVWLRRSLYCDLSIKLKA